MNERVVRPYMKPRITLEAHISKLLMTCPDVQTREEMLDRLRPHQNRTYGYSKFMKRTEAKYGK